MLAARSIWAFGPDKQVKLSFLILINKREEQKKRRHESSSTYSEQSWITYSGNIYLIQSPLAIHLIFLSRFMLIANIQGPNILLDDTLSTEVDKSLLNAVKDSIVQG